LSWPPTLCVNRIIDFYVEIVKKSEKLAKNCVYLCHRESYWSNLVLMLIWFISCQLVKAERHVEFKLSCCGLSLEASNPAVAFSHLNRNLMAVNRWLSKLCWNVHQIALVSLGTHFGHFVPRRSRNGCWSWRFSRWKLKGIYC
jgi:hypothetical protein